MHPNDELFQPMARVFHHFVERVCARVNEATWYMACSAVRMEVFLGGESIYSFGCFQQSRYRLSTHQRFIENPKQRLPKQLIPFPWHLFSFMNINVTIVWHTHKISRASSLIHTSRNDEMSTHLKHRFGKHSWHERERESARKGKTIADLME